MADETDKSRFKFGADEMTDDDINKWQEEVFSDGQANASTELAWANEQLIEANRAIDQFKGQFALMKFLRDENRMKAAKDEISRLRDMRGYLEHRISKLKGAG
jgi:hypothetical protein